MVEWYWQGKTEELGEKSAPVPLCPPQIPHRSTRTRTRPFAVRGQRLTAWAMARPRCSLTEIFCKVKQSNNTPWRRRGERRYSSYTFMTSTLEGMIGQRHAPAALYPRGKEHRYPFSRSWVGLRAGLDTEARGKVLCRGSNLNRPVVEPVARHYSDWATRLLSNDMWWWLFMVK
jgi:hypothetical protein